MSSKTAKTPINPVSPKRSLGPMTRQIGRSSADTTLQLIEIPRDQVLDYISEMCATLSHMSIEHKCDRLAALLDAAATEARDEMSD